METIFSKIMRKSFWDFIKPQKNHAIINQESLRYMCGRAEDDDEMPQLAEQ